MSEYNNYDVEDLGIPKSSMTDFLSALRLRLGYISELDELPDGVDMASVLRPLLCVGEPGIGKTACVENEKRVINERLKEAGIAKEFGFKKILLGQTLVGSLSGIPLLNPQTQEVVKVQASELPREEKDGKYGILFLDEITTADEAQIQPALGLCDDSRNIGEYELPEGWIVVAAGNGPDCTNFIRLDDMTLTRFQAFDIKYDYEKDWKMWASQTGIDPLIIAYLNTKPENIVSVRSREEHVAGKMFPCPRTWNNFSKTLTLEKAGNGGKDLAINHIERLASQYLGKSTGLEFATFAQIKDTLKVSPSEILSGKAKLPKGKLLTTEELHIILESCISLLMKSYGKALKEADTKGMKAEDVVIQPEVYLSFINTLTWFIALEKLAIGQSTDAVMRIFKVLPLSLSGLFIGSVGVLEGVPEEVIKFNEEVFDPYFERNMEAIESVLLDAKATYI